MTGRCCHTAAPQRPGVNLLVKLTMENVAGKEHERRFVQAKGVLNASLGRPHASSNAQSEACPAVGRHVNKNKNSRP